MEAKQTARLSSYRDIYLSIPLPNELRHHNKGLINLQNIDNKCLLWSLVRHLNPRKKNPQRITKFDREFG